jgi:hypothetical protein
MTSAVAKRGTGHWHWHVFGIRIDPHLVFFSIPMRSPADTPYLANLARWRKSCGRKEVVLSATLADVPDDLAKRVATVPPEYQRRYLAWYPLVSVEVTRRPELLRELLDLATSGRAATPEEFELALAFTVWTAESPDDHSAELAAYDPKPYWLSDEGFAAAMRGMLKDASEFEWPAQSGQESKPGDADIELEPRGPTDYSEHDDRLQRLHDLFSRESVPWQALDMWFVVHDDTCPLFDEDGLVARRAPVLHKILTELPDTFTYANVIRLSADKMAIGAALAALDEADIVDREGTFPDIMWHKLQTLDELRGTDIAEDESPPARTAEG